MRRVSLLLATVLALAGVARAAENVVTKVTARADGGKTVIVVHGSATPSFTAYRLERPARVVVDVADGKLGSDELRGGPIDVDTWAVGQIAMAQYADDASRTARVMIGFKRPGSYDVKAVGHDLVITVTPDEAMPADAMRADAAKIDEAHKRRVDAEAQTAATEQRRQAALEAERAAMSRAGEAQREAEAARARAQAAKDELDRVVSARKTEEQRLAEVQKRTSTASAQDEAQRQKLATAAQADEAQRQKLAVAVQAEEARLGKLRAEAQVLMQAREAEAKKLAEAQTLARKIAEERRAHLEEIEQAARARQAASEAARLAEERKARTRADEAVRAAQVAAAAERTRTSEASREADKHAAEASARAQAAEATARAEQEKLASLRAQAKSQADAARAAQAEVEHARGELAQLTAAQETERARVETARREAARVAAERAQALERAQHAAAMASGSLDKMAQAEREARRIAEERQKESARLEATRKELQATADARQKELARLETARAEAKRVEEQRRAEEARLAQLRDDVRKQSDALEQKSGELARTSDELQQKSGELAQKNGELARKNGELQQKSGEAARIAAELARRNGELARKNGELAQKNGELAQKSGELQQKSGELQQTSGEAARVAAELQQKSGELQQKNGELQRKAEELQQKSGELSRLSADEKAQREKLELARREAARLQAELRKLDAERRRLDAERRAVEAAARAQKSEADAQSATSKEEKARLVEERAELAKQLAGERAQLMKKLEVAQAEVAREIAAEKQKRVEAEALDRKLAAARAELERIEAATRQRLALVPTPAKVAAAKVSKDALPTEKVAVKVRDVRFADDSDAERVIVDVSGNADASVVRTDDRGAVLRIARADLPKKLERTLDASALGGPVRSVSTYADADDPGAVRVEVSLADGPHAQSKLVRTDGTLTWEFPRSGTRSVPPVKVAGYGVSVPLQMAESNPGGISGGTLPRAGGNRARRHVYNGRRMDLDFVNADIHNILRLLSDVGQVNIVLGDDVKGNVTIRMRDVPWDQALDVILKSKGLGMQREGNLIRVAPQSVLEKEMEAEVARAKSQVELKPLTTRLVPLSYADGAQIMARVAEVQSPRGHVSVDARTNQLIVTDVAENLALAEDLVHNLDTQTPQVLIESRIVEARSTFLRDIGIQWGGNTINSTGTGNPTGIVFPSTVGAAGGATDNATNTQGLQLGQSGATSPNYVVNMPAAVGTGSGGALGLTLGSLNGAININLRLSSLENSGQVRIISAPKIMTLDNIEASIEQGVSIPISQVSAAGVNTVFVDAKLNLTVKPHVTNEGSIVMNVNITRNEPDFVNVGARGDPTILKKQARTEMLVRDGDTAVIGGIYTRNTGLAYTKVPWFAEIPVIGWLFKNRRENDDRTELLIFITPRIVNRAVVAR
jgi:type IV pilus assembly protein PilQ